MILVPRWSASRLPIYCGHANVLDEKRERPKSTQQAADAGTLFHALVAYDRAKVAEMVKVLPAEMVTEAYGWWALYQETARAPAYAQHEVVLGIDEHGEYVETEEFEPHRYRAKDQKTPLLVGGRADLVWADPDCTYVADLKTGRTHNGDPDNSPQLMVHGLAAMSKRRAIEVRVGFWYARDAAWEWGDRMTAFEATERWLEPVREMAKRDESPVVGGWCAACWSRKDCSAVK